MKNIILSLIGTYFIFAFCLLDLNFSNWEVIERISTVWLGVIIGGYLEINNDKDGDYKTI